MSSFISLPASCHFICRSKRTYCSTLKSNYSQTNYSHTLWIGTTEYKLSFSESLTCFSLRFIFFSDFFSMFDQYVQRPRKNKVDVSVWVSFCKYSNVQYCATRIRTSNNNRSAHSQEGIKNFKDSMLHIYVKRVILIKMKLKWFRYIVIDMSIAWFIDHKTYSQFDLENNFSPSK